MVNKIIHITDSHLDEILQTGEVIHPKTHLNKVLAEHRNDHNTSVVFTGDIGLASSHKWFFNKLNNQPLNYSLVLGNHDNYNYIKEHYIVNNSSNTGKLYYANEDDNYKSIYLDTSKFNLGKKQLDWLSEEIVTPKKIIIFVHHPILHVETKVDDLYPLQDRDTIVRLLSTCDNDITVFCGHYHMADKKQFANITQYITPALSFQIEKDASEIKISTATYGYRVINIAPDAITTKLIMSKGNSFETVNEM